MYRFDRKNAKTMYASDSSLERYAFVEAEVSNDESVHDVGLVETAHVAHLMHKKEWPLIRHRWLGRPIKNVLNGEVCAFRKAAIEAAQSNPGQKSAFSQTARRFFSQCKTDGHKQ